MPDLRDGESVEMQGSGSKPYTLKNVGGVYSCTCPAWRNQSLSIEKRTCKHLRKLRGDAAEEARIGGAMPAAPVKASAARATAPVLLLAESWDNERDLRGWWMSEKLDGVRAFWDGKQFLSRNGNVYHAPDWFLAALPDVHLDGELWIDRKAFQRTVSIVRRQDKPDLLWKEVRYLVFDAPAVDDEFEDRMDFCRGLALKIAKPFILAHDHEVCRNVEHLRKELARVEALGGEGLMLREPGSRYQHGRSSSLLKVKTFHDGDAKVIGHEPGKGKHKGRLGALLVELVNGTQFSVGTGFSDAERGKPPPIGSIITFRYQELSDGGVPRFPSFVKVRRNS
jgi:DNA ligase-1